MIDSTNPRILANHIKKLWAKVNTITPGTVVEGNPSGSGFNTLLTKIKIGSHKYKLPADVTANPEGEATDALTKIGIGSDVLSVGGGASIPDYSSTEHLAGMKWVDGSDIYEKTIYNAGGSTGAVLIAHNISNFSKLICAYGSLHDDYEGGSEMPIPRIGPGGVDIGVANVTATNIELTVNSNYSASRIKDIYITIRYTKTSEAE